MLVHFEGNTYIARKVETINELPYSKSQVENLLVNQSLELSKILSEANLISILKYLCGTTDRAYLYLLDGDPTLEPFFSKLKIYWFKIGYEKEFKLALLLNVLILNNIIVIDKISKRSIRWVEHKFTLELDDEYIAKTLGYSMLSIFYLRCLWLVRKYTPWSVYDQNELINMYNSGCSREEMGLKLKRTKDSIGNQLQVLGLTKKDKKFNDKEISEP